MDPLVAEHVRRNNITRDAWHGYAPHRAIVTELLMCDRSADRARLCVLGAGNTNDLDLPRLAGGFAELHLVDIDEAALAAGTARQCGDATDQIVQHGGVDVTGLLTSLSDRAPEQPFDGAEVDRLLDAARDFPGPALPGPFDVVASTCLLTQLIDSVVTGVGAAHPRLVELVLAVRDRHLRLLAELSAPGGRGVLITDFVSSDSCAALATVPEAEFPQFVARLVGERNFFTGANPQVLHKWFAQNPALEQVRMVRPWRWQVGPRAFAVCGLDARRRS